MAALNEPTVDDGHVEQWEHLWRGHTPKEALAARVHRLREARADYTVDGLTITVRNNRGTVERLTFTDA